MSSLSLRHKVSVDGSDYLGDNLLADPDVSPLNGSQVDDEDSTPPPLQLSPLSSRGNGRLVVAIDYGTTFTGLAFATTDSDQADLKKIEVLQDWTPKMSNQQKVRSVISYAKALQGESQWGSDISDNAITMVNTKLELEPQDSRFDELDLTLNVLKGTGNLTFEHMRKAGPDPEYTSKPPVEIVTDYLTKVSECDRKVIDIEQLKVTKTPVDIVVTVPVNWSYQAYDSVFKAIRRAGFNKTTFPTLKDTILVSEPEAASYFTARDLRDTGTIFLEEEDCFILCDAGGGTVDVVSFQVKKINPHFDLEKVTEPTGFKCGSALIDTAFKSWLRDIIGKDRYAELDPVNARQQRISPHTVETGPMRELIKRFIVKKSAFSNSSRTDIKIDLPAPLTNLSLEGRVKDGELIIHAHEMKKLMDTCVNGVIKLIKDQIKKVREGQNRRVRDVLLVGGFGASPYLQAELEKSLKLRNMKMRRPDKDKSWTAVVQGAVIYGIEKARHSDARYMLAIMKSYAILVDGRFEWLIRKGDLVISNEKTTKHSRIFWLPARDCVQGKHEFPIFFYKARDKDDDDVPQWWQDGQHEVEQAGLVKCDFSNYISRQQQPIPNSLVPGTPNGITSRSNIGPLMWRLKLSKSSIEAEILLNEARIARCEIKVEVDCPSERRYSTGSWHDGDD